jgi:hypothetical protein
VAGAEEPRQVKIEIVEAKPYHCGQIARMLRLDQSLGAASRGFNAHRELHARFGASAWRRACLLDGRLAALGGVMGTQAESDGNVWLAIADWATRHPRALLRAAGEAFADLGRVKRRLGTLILIEDAPSFRFAQHLGFSVRRDADTSFETVLMERNL